MIQWPTLSILDLCSQSFLHFTFFLGVQLTCQQILANTTLLGVHLTGSFWKEQIGKEKEEVRLMCGCAFTRAIAVFAAGYFRWPVVSYVKQKHHPKLAFWFFLQLSPWRRTCPSSPYTTLPSWLVPEDNIQHRSVSGLHADLAEAELQVLTGIRRCKNAHVLMRVIEVETHW